MKKIYRLPEVRQITGGYSAVHLARLEAKGLFPKRFKLSPEGGKYGACGWSADEVDAWVESRIKSRQHVARTAMHSDQQVTD